jgi:hypothetical protein
MYEAVNAEGSVWRYRTSEIEERIKREEYETTPEYRQERAEAAETERLRAEAATRQKAKEDKELAEIAQFTEGDSPMAAGQKRDALLKQFRFDGVVMSRKAKVEQLVAEGKLPAVETIDGKERHMVGGYEMGKSGFDYASYLLANPTANPARRVTPQLTPMQQHWAEIKKEVGSALVALRLGDFYEFFGDDAALVSKTLKITLTTRGTMPMAGIPVHAADAWFKTLRDAGFEVAVAEVIHGKPVLSVPVEPGIVSGTPLAAAADSASAQARIRR